ncbi:hypothetical protein Peur_014399 [Populus x canadensis]
MKIGDKMRLKQLSTDSKCLHTFSLVRLSYRFSDELVMASDFDHPPMLLAELQYCQRREQLITCARPELLLCLP